MQVSARNQIPGVVTEIVRGVTTSHVRIDIGSAIVTASISSQAIDDLKLVEGRKATVLIKASDVLVGVED